MTEYTTSSEAIREYMSARERTARWVVETHRHDETHNALLSPSSPPSVLDDPDAPIYGPSDSDCESSHSMPPQMVLRWDDGRPDQAIPYDSSGSRSRSRPTKHTPSRHPIPDHMMSQPLAIPTAASHRSRHAQTLSYATAPPEGGPNQISRSPESIVVLPSRESEESSQHAPQDSHRSAPSHRAGEGHPRAPTHHSSRTAHHPPAVISPTPRLPYASSHGVPPRSTHSPPVMYSQSQPLPMSTTGGARFLEQQAASQSRVTSHLPYNYSPPAIIYAPSSKHSKSRYAPPAIVYSPPSHPHMNGRYPPPSMVHSQSAPPQHNALGSHPDPAHAGSRAASRHHSHTTSSIIHEEPREHHRSRSRGRSRGPTLQEDVDGSRGRSQRGRRGLFGRPSSRSRSPTPSLSGSDAGSDSSAGTYYILPTPGQKVQIIVPNGKSAYTATTTTAHSPQSYTSSRKPFLQRFFPIPKFSTPSVTSHGSSGSRRSARKLQRRHTIGGAHLRHPEDVAN